MEAELSGFAADARRQASGKKSLDLFDAAFYFRREIQVNWTFVSLHTTHSNSDLDKSNNDAREKQKIIRQTFGSDHVESMEMHCWSLEDGVDWATDSFHTIRVLNAGHKLGSSLPLFFHDQKANEIKVGLIK